MPKLAILIPGSAKPAFYSQIAAISLALRALRWTSWEPVIYAYFGEKNAGDDGEFVHWRQHLKDVEIFRVSPTRFSLEGNWAQVDSAMNLAPRDADAVLSMDADTLPVRNFEPVIEEIREADGIGGVLAHYPFPGSTGPTRGVWDEVTAGLTSKPLDFSYAHSLMGPADPAERREAPFYLNGGVIFYSRSSFERFVPRYLRVRNALMTRMANPDFSAQVATTIAIAEEGIPSVALPMRYNFPNDPVAEALYPGELDEVAIFHYLRTTSFDRHRIFASAEEYALFMGMPLTGANLRFQQAVRAMFGEAYPFGQGEPAK
jgi:hypothetical protein